MAIFVDVTEQDRFTILFEGRTEEGNVMNILVPFSQADEKNGNGRIYSKALLKREIDRVQDDIQKGGFLGTADHPESGNTELRSVSHIVRKMWLEKDGRAWAELGILDTQKGRDLKTIIKSGGRLGVSTRGFGTMDDTTGKVNDDYKLANLDIVANPSYKDGVFSKDNIFESVDLSKKMESKMMHKKSSEKLIKSKDVRQLANEAGISPQKMADLMNADNQKKAVTENRLALYKQTRLSCGTSATNEEVLKIVDRLEEAQRNRKIEKPVVLTEAEKVLEIKKKRKQKRVDIAKQFHKDGALAGFTRDQIDRAVEKRMAELDEEEI